LIIGNPMEIGGYFELELRKGTDYHSKALKLNTGRNAFEYILKSKSYRKVYLPYFTCDVMLEPIHKLGLESEFYHINEEFEPIFNYSNVAPDETFVYTNYFGLFDHIVAKLVGKCPNLIIDNAQAFFSKPIKGIDTFYSARKFLGVPDGAYLFINNSNHDLIKNCPFYKSADRFEHLLKRIEMGAEEGYESFKNNSKSLVGEPIKKMSLLTQRILESIDYQFVAEQRRTNYKYLHDNLKGKNSLDLCSNELTVPMVYPFLTDKTDLRTKLIKNNIFIATYWPNVLEWCDLNSLEHKLAKNILHLPIDQRYGKSEMKVIVDFLKRYL
jgi:hypothetical protein